jgi:glycoside/pentoside/hexuronide:cation symporter, GPH family
LTAASRRLPLRIALPFSAPTIPISAIGLVAAVYLPNYFASHLALSMTAIGLVWMSVRLVDLPADVVLAILMDHTRSRLGRYRPWLVAGAPVTMLALYALFMAPSDMTSGQMFWWLFVLALGISILSLAHQAWTAILAPHYDERSRLFGIINAVGVIGVLVAMAVLIAGPSLGLDSGASVRACGWVLILATPLGVASALIAAPEFVAPDAPSRPALRDFLAVLIKPDLIRLFFSQLALSLGPNWMSSIYLFFFTASRGFTSQQASILLAIYILANLPGALLTALIARRIGKHRALMVTAAAFSLALPALLLAPKGDLFVVAPMMAFEGVVAAGFNMMIQAMLADVGDEIRLSQGRQQMSLVYSVNTLASKLALAASIGMSFPLLQALGFNPHEGAVNTPAALHNLDLAFLAGPMVFVLLGAACVIGWRLDGARHEEIRAKLAARDAELAAVEEAVSTVSIPLGVKAP